MRIAIALFALTLLAACSGEKAGQVAKVTPDERTALDEAGAMIGAPRAGESVAPTGAPVP